jgi:hypothetical protein
MGEGRKQFFFEKKAAPALRETKKLLLMGRAPAARARA